MSVNPMSKNLSGKTRKAVIAALDMSSADFDVEPLLDELELLLGNLGVTSVGRIIQKRDHPDAGCFLGIGKAEEAALFCASVGAGLIVCNGQLAPGQRATLSKITKCEVWDRAFVIMKIFERRARSQEAKLQVERALCAYEIPYLKGLGRAMSRLGGGIGTRGPGETEFERHRRKLERRLRDISGKLRVIRDRRRLSRERRAKERFPVISLAGYTNSGKSTLLRRLSGDETLIAEDRLFSTLDTFIRGVRLPSGRTILVADTVGFIRDLPHSLIDAFRATLEEICQSSLILLVLDAGAPDCLETFRVVTTTLGDIGAGEVRRIVLLNKTDTCREEDVVQLRERIAGDEDVVLPVSAVDGSGVDSLLRYLDEFFQQEEKP